MKSLNGCKEFFSATLDQVMCQFQMLNYMGGYIYKAAKAGNLNARLVLAKLIIRSFSGVYQGRNEEALRSESVEIEKSRKCARASAFISYFEDQSNASNAVDLLHTNLVKTFLKEASLEELLEMKPYIDDYVLKCLINTSIVNRHYLMFHIKLEALTDSRDIYFLRESSRTFSKAFHDLCCVARSTMHRLGLGMNSMISRNLRLTSMKVIKYIYCSNTLVKCFNDVTDLIIEGYKEAYNQDRVIANDDNPQVVTPLRMIDKLSAVQECLFIHQRLLMRSSKIRDDLISEFDILFL